MDAKTAIVQTVDIITPIVDDAFSFGAVAFANAVSDIYAMGGTPVMALNIMGFPVGQLPMDIMTEIFRGAQEKAKEAGCLIAGGHTIDDAELKYGLAVTGFVHPERVLKNSTAKEGDVLVLTKPLGLGILTTAVKKEKATSAQEENAIRVMTQLNKKGSECAIKAGVSSMTDVTGFGLLGHLSEMTTGSKAGAVIFSDRIPVLDGVMDFAKQKFAPGGAFSNMDYVLPLCHFEPNVPEEKKLVLCDPQTSGGLLMSCPRSETKALIEALRHAGFLQAAEIGWIVEDNSGKIKIC